MLLAGPGGTTPGPDDGTLMTDARPQGAHTSPGSRLSRRSLSPQWRQAMRYAGILYLSVRLGLSLVAVLATGLLRPYNPIEAPGWPAQAPAGWSQLLTVWERFDALWYLSISINGYSADNASAAFFPVYPLLIRAVSTLGVPPLVAALLVSNAAYYVALVLVHAITSREFDEHTAQRATLYLVLSPFALFFLAPYTESLFLAVAAGCLWAARRGRWNWAALLGTVGSATRASGFILALAVAAEAVDQARQQHGRERLKRLLPGLSAAAAIPLGLVAYAVYWHLYSGDGLRPARVQEVWDKEFTWYGATLAAAARLMPRDIGEFPNGYSALDALLVIVAIACAVWVVRHAPLSYAVFTVGALLLPLFGSSPLRPLASMPRYLIPLFPLYWALAKLGQRYKCHELIVASSAAGLALCTALFVNWYYIY